MTVAGESRLVERERELEIIRAAIGGEADATGRLLLIEGPAGIGKTQLLRAAREAAEEVQMRALHARGTELEREFPYGLARQLFEQALLEAPDEDRRALMSGAAKNVEPLFSAESSIRLAAVGDSTFPILHGLYWLAANMAERRPLMLAVDDAHWGDPESLRFLHYLAGRLEETPVLLAITTRPPEPGTQAELIAAIASNPAAEIIRPAPLSDAAVAALVKSALGADAAGEFCEACHRASGGNPFVLHDLLSELRAEGITPTAAAAADVANVTPKTVSRMILLRLARLPQEARRLAEETAVLGDGAELRDAAALAGIDTAASQEAADQLAGAGLLVPGRPLSFVHPLTRAAIYNDLPLGKRSRAHQAAARLLAARGADLDSIAVHLLASDPAGDSETVELLRTAASRALERGTPEAAVRYLRRAWAEPAPDDQRHAVLVELVVGSSRAADPPTATELQELPIDELTGNDQTLASCAQELAWVLTGSGHPEQASAVLGQAIDAASRTEGIGLELQFEVQRLFIDLARPSEIKARMERYRDLVEPGTAAHRLWFAVEAWRLMLVGEDARRAAELARQALVDWQIFTEQPSSAITGQLMLVLTMAEDFEFAGQAFEVMLAGARALGAAPLEAITVGLRSELEFRRGMIADAATDARTAIEVARTHAFLPAVPLMIWWIVKALIERGELDAAEHELELSGMTAEVPDQLSWTSVLHCRAQLKLAQGKSEGALEDFREIARREARSETSFFTWDSDLAVALASLGEEDEARGLAERGLESAHRWGTAGRIGHATRALGLAAGGEDGLEYLRDAVDLLRGSPATLEYMRALTDYGAALRRAGRRTDAREPLRETLALARPRGALAIARRAHEELEATGEKLRPLVVAGVESLTPSERRIAGLAADGLTNREIAQTLFLSVKTVESHLRGAFRKLDVHSREELPRALEGGGPR
jgi:DNA-binding CsgD family transcriptional regulator